mmetsp:Transcript_69102/g.174215  ORF Transcript_69102/g.174215 Transcript_69102/m.174215 type:complete len:250 (+) Transcript_69102:5066-5815(+)
MFGPPVFACGLLIGLVICTSSSSPAMPMSASIRSATAVALCAASFAWFAMAFFRCFAPLFSDSEFTMMLGPMATGPCFGFGAAACRPPAASSAARFFSSCQSSRRDSRRSKSWPMNSKASNPRSSSSADSSAASPGFASSVSKSWPMSSSTVSEGAALETGAAAEDEEEPAAPELCCFTRCSSQAPRNQTRSLEEVPLASCFSFDGALRESPATSALAVLKKSSCLFSSASSCVGSGCREAVPALESMG